MSEKKNKQRVQNEARECGQVVVDLVRDLVARGLTTHKEIGQVTGSNNTGPTSKIINDGREPLSGFLVCLGNGLSNPEARARVRALFVTDKAAAPAVKLDAAEVTLAIAEVSYLAGSAMRDVMKFAAEHQFAQKAMPSNARRMALRRGPEMVARLKELRASIDVVGGWIDGLTEEALGRRRALTLTGTDAGEQEEAP
jgi:nitrous oxide reductase accessory protein NosL